MCSFHFGDLFCKTSNNDIRFCLYRWISTDDVELLELPADGDPVRGGGDVAVGRWFNFGNKMVIFRGPLVPKMLVSYKAAASSVLGCLAFCPR